MSKQGVGEQKDCGYAQADRAESIRPDSLRRIRNEL
jgi:hypothetical protein